MTSHLHILHLAISQHITTVERRLDVRFCGQPWYCNWPYNLTVTFWPSSSHMLSAELLPDRPRSMTSKSEQLSPCHVNYMWMWTTADHKPRGWHVPLTTLEGRSQSLHTVYDDTLNYSDCSISAMRWTTNLALRAITAPHHALCNEMNDKPGTESDYCAAPCIVQWDEWQTWHWEWLLRPPCIVQWDERHTWHREWLLRRTMHCAMRWTTNLAPRVITTPHHALCSVSPGSVLMLLFIISSLIMKLTFVTESRCTVVTSAASWVSPVGCGSQFNTHLSVYVVFLLQFRFRNFVLLSLVILFINCFSWLYTVFQ